MHLHAFSCLQLQKDPAQLRQLRGVVGRAAHLRRKFNDQGQNPSCKWHRVPGGEKGERESFRCGAHEDCTVRVRLLRKGDAFYMEKLKDTKHSSVRAEFDRKNAALTKEQKASFMLRKQGGSSASEIMKKDQQGAVTAGAKRKEGADATGVEGVPFGRFLDAYKLLLAAG
jgi:hypothetical protein